MPAAVSTATATGESIGDVCGRRDGPGQDFPEDGVQWRRVHTEDRLGVGGVDDVRVLVAARLIELASEHLDFSKPVGVVLQMVLGHLSSEQEAKTLIRTVMDAAAPGSYLLICDAIRTEEAQAARKANKDYSDRGAAPYHAYPLATLRSRFDGLEFVEPGLVSAPLWRPDDHAGPRTIGRTEPEPLKNVFGGLARKPNSNS